MSDLNQINDLLKYHLSLKNLYSDEKLWRIQESETGGRGIFANRDIHPGEIIFTDYPLLIGPRAGSNFTYNCVVCYELNNLYACTKGCGLPICSHECEHSHIIECELIRKLTGKLFSEIISEIFRCLSPLRIYLINQKLQKLFKYFTYHFNSVHGGEINAVKQYMNFKNGEEYFLKIVCSILDTNTFATVIQKNNKQLSMRALYPLSAFMNHSCCPNVTHLYNHNQQMIVKASNFIPKDSELLITYTSLLWGTYLRRYTQYISKHFWCCCERCKDPKEFGTCLNGLKCTFKGCKGLIYPMDPLNNFCDWKCDSCSSVVLYKTVAQIQSQLGILLQSISNKNIEQIIDFMNEELKLIVPEANYVNYEVKVKVIWCLGHKAKYLWNDLSPELLSFKEKLCLDVLETLKTLRLGLCKMRGLILYELYRTRFEIYSRLSKKIENLQTKNEENLLILKESAAILENDVCAPQEIIDFLNTEMNK